MGLGWLMVGILAYDDDCLFGCSSCVLSHRQLGCLHSITNALPTKKGTKRNKN